MSIIGVLSNGGRAKFDENYWQSVINKAMTQEELNPTAKKLKFAAHAEIVSSTVLNGKLLIIDDMGHGLNPLFFYKIITAIIAHTHPNSCEK